MVKRMLIDAAHPEETRVVVLNGHRLEEFDFETSTKKQIKGNIYLAKVTRVEPSLQAAFVEYGGNRHGFLAFGEIHPDYYRIPVADRQAALEAQRVAEAEADEDEERHAEFGTAEHGGEVEEAGLATLPDHLPETADADVLRGPEVEDNVAAEEWHDETPHGDAPEEPEEEMPPLQSAESPLATEPDEFVTPFTSPAPEDDAFAEDDAVQNLASESAGEDHGTSEASVDIVARSEDAELHAGAAVPEAIVETVGGDEIEETVRRRARPYRHYKIQEVIKRRQIMLVQVTKEERGNKGAALTTYISLAGRYCVLMPNTPRGGGVSRKITSMTDRRRLKDLVSDLEVPEGMGVIVRTAGSERSRPEIKRDFEYLLRLWDEIRELTLKSTAPALIYEEGNLIKRAIRDLYSRDIDEVLVDGHDGYETAKSFMRMLMPSHTKRVKFYNDPSIPLFHRFQVEGQLDVIHSPVVQLRSGGYLVINPTEALVAIDVNSGRSTRERNIEETALKTNLEAADEVARQLRLRDLAGLIVIDFIDMEERRNNGAVERRVKEAMRYDRARIQLGRISPFGLLELSRQRLRPSLLEASTQPCPHCNGTGNIRSTESTALHVLRAIEEEGMRRRSAQITVAVPSAIALYILNQKRAALQQAEARYGIHVTVTEDNALVPPAFRLDRVRALTPAEIAALPVLQPLPIPAEEEAANEAELEAEEEEIEQVLAPENGAAEIEALDQEGWGGVPSEASGATWSETSESSEAPASGEGRGRRRRRRRRRGVERHHEATESNLATLTGELAAEGGEAFETTEEEGTSGQTFGEAPAEEPGTAEHGEPGERKRRRRGRRGGRRRRHSRGGEGGPTADIEQAQETAAEALEDIQEPAPSYIPPDIAAAENGETYAPSAEPPTPAPSFAVDATRRNEAEAAPAAQPAAEAERAPIAYNVPPAHDVSGPPSNPRRGWWRR